MRRIILDLAVSLDGFIEGPNGETDWCILDDDMNVKAFLDSVDTIFYGRASYDAWGNYPAASAESLAEQEFWNIIHSKQKIVFSRQSRNDGKAKFVSKDIAATVETMKRQEGKDIWLYGGAGLIKTFADEGLIDVYRISVHPTVLGSGKPLFENLQHRITLKLIETKTFRSGVVQVVYEPQQ